MCSVILILEEIHRKKYVLTDLNPDRFVYDTKNNRLVLTQLMSLNKTKEYCRSHLSSYHYCAPEALMMDVVAPQADFYSLGLLAYEMMTQDKAMSEE